MAYLYIVLAAILWGVIGIFSKALSKLGFDATQIVFVRAFGATIALFTYIIFARRKALVIKWKDSIYFIGTGIVSFVFFNWCYFNAIELTSLSVAAILLYTAPTIVTFMAIVLFKEKLTRKKLISLGLTFAGCLLVTVFSGGSKLQISLWGVLAGLGSGIGYALYSIFGRYALKKYDTLTVTFYTFVFATLGLIPITNIGEMPALLQKTGSGVNALALCLISTVLPFLLYTKGLTKLETSKAAIIATLEPIVATVVGVFMFHEPVTALKILGILLVVAAVKVL